LTLCRLGSDATAHMAEETRDAARIVPRAMVLSYMINAGLSFVILVTYCFLLVDYDSVLASPAGQLGVPFVQVFVTAAHSVSGGTALLAIMAIVQIFGLCNWMASTARQIFAFARDHGMPFGRWIAKVDSKGTHPVNSILIVWVGACLLPLITLGSTIAFDALTSLQIIALMATYMISMSSILWRRLFSKQPLPASPWTLGRAALPVNLIGWLYCIYQIIFLPWPLVIPVTPQNFNWSSVMFAGIVGLAVIYYVVYGHRKYDGPVAYVRAREVQM
jgi:choline transport protein